MSAVSILERPRPEYHDPDPLTSRYVLPLVPPVRAATRPVQIGLFALPDTRTPLEIAVENALPEILLKFPTKRGRISRIARKFKVTKEEAEKVCKAAESRVIFRLKREHWERNKEWYAYVGTPEYLEYCRAYCAECDRRLAEDKARFDEAIANSTEHVVVVEAVKPGTNMRGSELQVCAQRLGVTITDEQVHTWDTVPTLLSEPGGDLEPEERDERSERQHALWDGHLKAKEALVESLRPATDKLLSLLDNPRYWANVTCDQFPVSWGAKQTRITEKDLRIMVARKFARVILGDERTLFTAHEFYQWAEADSEGRSSRGSAADYEPPTCAVCGRELTYNEIGLCSKLGYNPPKCMDCLEYDKAEFDNIIQFYKNSGCTLFI